MLRKLTLLFASTLTIMSAATIAPSLPQMAEVFENIPQAEFLTKLVLTLPTLFIAISAPFAGRFIDRHGRVKLLFYGLIAYAVTGSTGYYLEGLYEILIGRVFLGLTIGILMTITTTLVGDYFEGDERRKFVGLQVAFVSFGGVLFIGAGGFLADIHWRLPFLIYGFSLVILPFAIAFLNEPVLSNNSEVDLNKANDHTPFYLLFAAVFIIWVLFFMVPVQIPFLLKSLNIKSNTMIGAAVATNTGCAALASLIYSRVKKYLTYPRVFAVALICMAVGYLLVWKAQSFFEVQIGMIFSGAGMGLVIPNTTLWLINRTPEHVRGKEIGMLTRFRFLGQFFSPILIQPLAINMGLSDSFQIAGLFLAVLSLFFLFYQPNSSNHGKRKDPMAPKNEGIT